MDKKRKPTPLELFQAQIDPASVMDAIVPAVAQTQETEEEHALRRAKLRALQALQGNQ